MAILFIGTSECEFVRAVGTRFALSTPSVTPTANLGCEEVVGVQDNNSILADFTGQTDLWMCWSMSFANESFGEGEILFYDTNQSTTQAVLRLRFVGADAITLSRWDGASWTDIDTLTDSNFFSTGSVRCDVHIVVNDTTGSVQLYLGGVISGIDFSGDTNGTAYTSIDRVEFVGTDGAFDFEIGNCIIADEDTRDLVLVQHTTASGSVNDQASGTESSIDERGVGLSDFVLFDAAGEIITLNTSYDAAFDSGYTVDAVYVTCAARKTAGSPSQIRGVTRIGSTNYTSASQSLGSSFDTFTFAFTVDPSDSNAWTPADVGGAEFGIETVT